jgi:hypothetical protein
LAKTGYIVPNDLLEASPPRCEWYAEGIPGDPTQSLVAVNWDGSTAEEEFESVPGVQRIPEKWEPMPDAMAALLASFQETPAAGKATTSIGIPSVIDPVPAAPETVAVVLKKTPSQLARMLR